MVKVAKSPLTRELSELYQGFLKVICFYYYLVAVLFVERFQVFFFNKHEAVLILSFENKAFHNYLILMMSPFRKEKREKKKADRSRLWGAAGQGFWPFTVGWNSGGLNGQVH
ncbi:MAG: hypothetical protein AAGI25_19680 [Bacteroidota bacterium]